MSLRMTEEQYAELMQRRAQTKPITPGAPAKVQCFCVDELASYEMKPKRSKYGNHRVEVDGMKFDSQHEANVYRELALRVKAGELRCVCRQVKFDLPGGIVYIADFVTIGPDMRIEAVIDAKSEATKKNRVYINKKKQMKACWGIDILEV